VSVLYRCEEDVAIGMAGSVPIEKNGHISVEVRQGHEWSGTLELWDPDTRLPDMAMLRGDDGEELPFRILSKSDSILQIEQFSNYTRPPCKKLARETSGSVQILDEHQQVLDRGFLLAQVYNDETWTGVVYLEGNGIDSGLAFSDPGKRVYIVADDSDTGVLADVKGTSLSFQPNAGQAISVDITGALDSPPPF
jgi:hypothetical protein